MLTVESSEANHLCLEIELTKKCNLKCSYCCAETDLITNKCSDELKIKRYFEIIDYFEKK